MASMMALASALTFLGFFCTTLAQCSISVLTSPYSIILNSGSQILVNNNAILAGSQNTTVSPVFTSSSGQIANNGGQIEVELIKPTIAKIQVNTTSNFVGARFSYAASDKTYGVWEYPWNDTLDNAGIAFDLKGVGNSEGVNWDNARAPFFISTSGFGVYADTLTMGSYDFTTPGRAQFIFNSSSLVYYIILPTANNDLKSILSQYISLSAPIELPPDSGYGPTFWSDNFEQDFHAEVTNAQENYYDVVNHLYYNQIRATSMFADR
jgi:alpha-D-xyloside xylohydrolase